MHIPRILIAAPASGSGKTAVTCALLAALKARGLRVRACKCGPDYIDPMFHLEAAGVDSRNLDLFFSGKDGIRDELSRHGADADLVVAEGVMGYYDGRSVDTDEGSSYDVARTLEMPVLLVVNGRGAALSLAALVSGMAAFRPDSNIRGLLLNRVSEMLYPRLKEMLEKELGRSGLDIPVLGYIPEDEAFRLESRHLGARSEKGRRFYQKVWNLTGSLKLQGRRLICRMRAFRRSVRIMGCRPGRSGSASRRTRRSAFITGQIWSFWKSWGVSWCRSVLFGTGSCRRTSAA